ncbi:hypothetical protein E8D34_00135 [Nocardioides sp. GY 10113]|nr:hypothetical protein E8D34_00135 [Nocardioides sp. GY 10113]
MAWVGAPVEMTYLGSNLTRRALGRHPGVRCGPTWSMWAMRCARSRPYVRSMSRPRRAAGRIAVTGTAAAVAIGGVAASAPEASSARDGGAIDAPTPPACDEVRTRSSRTAHFIDGDGTLFFTVRNRRFGEELWVSDGTSGSTGMVKDIGPGRADGFDAAGYDRSPMAAAGGLVLFAGDDGVRGRQLWASDGTEAGTALVKEIGSSAPPYYDEGPASLTGMGGAVYFSAEDEAHGHELWRSDGTEAGTALVKDLRPTEYDGYPRNLTAVGDRLFFTARDGVHGEELWVSDGTEAGTALAKDLRPGVSSSEVRGLTGVGGRAFFLFDDGVHGEELWTSDGTAAGTVLAKDIRPGRRYAEVRELTGLGNMLFFTADDGVHGRELWTSDGTEAGTVIVKESLPGRPSAFPDYLTAAGGHLFFTRWNRAHGYSLWKTDGTRVGTVRVKSFPRGPAATYPWDLVGVGGSLYFRVDDGVHGDELWRSDGTEAGTVLVRDIRRGSRAGYPRDLAAVGDRLYFTANDGIHGDELWTSDGTGAGTMMVDDIDAHVIFRVLRRTEPNTRKGTLRVGVRVGAAGTIEMTPVGRSLLRPATVTPGGPGESSLLLRPTREGRRTLRRTGRLVVTAEFTYSPCGGVGASRTRSYTLRLR